MNVIVQLRTIQFIFKISFKNIFLHLYLHFECTLCLFIHCATSQIRSISISYIQNKSKIILNPAASLCMVLTLWLLSNKIIPSYRSFALFFLLFRTFTFTPSTRFFYKELFNIQESGKNCGFESHLISY